MPFFVSRITEKSHRTVVSEAESATEAAAKALRGDGAEMTAPHRETLAVSTKEVPESLLEKVKKLYKDFVSGTRRRGSSK